MAQQAMADGSAFQRFKAFIEAQGGDSSFLADYSLLKQPLFSKVCIAQKQGFVTRIEADAIGFASQHLGAGRKTKEDQLDFSSGIVLSKKVGDAVTRGDVLATFYADDEEKLQEALVQTGKAFEISEKKPVPSKLIKTVLEKIN